MSKYTGSYNFRPRWAAKVVTLSPSTSPKVLQMSSAGNLMDLLWMDPLGDVSVIAPISDDSSRKKTQGDFLWLVSWCCPTGEKHTFFCWVFEVMIMSYLQLNIPSRCYRTSRSHPYPTSQSPLAPKILVPVFLTTLVSFLHKTSFFVQLTLMSPGLCSQ